MDYIKITFADLQPEQKEILIAQLADAGYEGFEEADNSLFAFIKTPEFDKALLNEISFKYQTPFTSEKIIETNWNKVWESNFDPVIVENIIAIRADFHEPISTTKFEILITPKMSFGTGHHATTYMMIRLMNELDMSHKSVMDFGTGTGILAIFAEKLGANDIIAIDNDDWSIENARENFEKNNCKKIRLQKAFNARTDQRFDVILANINKNIILENFPILKEQVNSSGKLLLSGLLQADKKDIIQKANELDLKVENTLEQSNWIAIQLSK